MSAGSLYGPLMLLWGLGWPALCHLAKMKVLAPYLITLVSSLQECWGASFSLPKIPN